MGSLGRPMPAFSRCLISRWRVAVLALRCSLPRGVLYVPHRARLRAMKAGIQRSSTVYDFPRASPFTRANFEGLQPSHNFRFPKGEARSVLAKLPGLWRFFKADLKDRVHEILLISTGRAGPSCIALPMPQNGPPWVAKAPALVQMRNIKTRP
jgi:hypothetical protein